MSSDEDNDEVGSVSNEDISNEESQSCTEIASNPSTSLVLYIVSINISFPQFFICVQSLLSYLDFWYHGG